MHNNIEITSAFSPVFLLPSSSFRQMIDLFSSWRVRQPPTPLSHPPTASIATYVATTCYCCCCFCCVELWCSRAPALRHSSVCWAGIASLSHLICLHGVWCLMEFTVIYFVFIMLDCPVVILPAHDIHHIFLIHSGDVGNSISFFCECFSYLFGCKSVWCSMEMRWGRTDTEVKL